MSEINDQLKEALRESINELFLSDDAAHSSKFIEILNDVRSDLNMIMMTDKYAEKYIWEKFRDPISMQQTLMSTTATFLQAIDDIDKGIERLVPCLVPFTNKSQIVDDETITKAVEQDDLLSILRSNYWLFFVLYAMTNMRIVLETTLEHIPTGKASGGGS